MKLYSKRSLINKYFKYYKNNIDYSSMDLLKDLKKILYRNNLIINIVDSKDHLIIMDTFGLCLAHQHDFDFLWSLSKKYTIMDENGIIIAEHEII